MIKEKKFFFFGFGQVSKYFVKDLIKKRKKFKLISTSTKKTHSKSITKKKFKSFFFKDKSYDNGIKNKLTDSNCILVSIPPKKNTDLVLKNFKKDLLKGDPKKIVYLSSTSVYGDHNGKWVDEKSKLKPISKFGKHRLQCEKKWLKFQKKNSLNINILRLSGIYSKENNAIKRLKNKNNKVFVKKNHFFSRIRVEDISQVLEKIFSSNQKGQIFNVSDNRPASSLEVYNYAAKILKKKNLKILSAKNLKNSMLKNFFKESKKVSNRKIKRVLNLKLKYPTYKEGLRNLRY